MPPIRRAGRALLAALVLAFTAAAPAWAWLGAGHMTIGALAYDDLMRRDPAAVAAIVHIMESHPDRARFDRALAGLPPGPARDRRLFELMARWPDEVRRTPYDHDDWHYSQKAVSGMRWALPVAFGKAEPEFRRQLAIARDAHAPAAERAVALCWVFHIEGDMHEPLHAGFWMDARFPLTDQGGNTAWVKTAPDAPPMKLHWFWDSAGRSTGPGDGRGRESPAALEAEVAAAHPDPLDPPPADPDAAFARWVRDTREIARRDVYENGAFTGGTTPAAAVVMSPAYVARAQAIGSQQLALAGWRLGALLAGVR